MSSSYDGSQNRCVCRARASRPMIGSATYLFQEDFQRFRWRKHQASTDLLTVQLPEMFAVAGNQQIRICVQGSSQDRHVIGISHATLYSLL